MITTITITDTHFAVYCTVMPQYSAMIVRLLYVTRCTNVPFAGQFLLRKVLSLRKPIVAPDTSSWLRRMSVILVGQRRGNSIASFLIVPSSFVAISLFRCQFFFTPIK